MFNFEGDVLKIKIGDDYEISPSNSTGINLTIKESVNISQPIAELRFYNNGNLINENLLFDKQKFEIRISNNDIDFVMPFNLFNYEIIRGDTEGYNVLITLIYDCKDLQSSRVEYVKGNSTDVFKMIANRLNLNYLGNSSEDYQNWIRPGIRGSSWLDQVSKASYKDDKSCFVWAVSKDNYMNFINVPERLNQKPEKILMNSDANVRDYIEVLKDPYEKINFTSYTISSTSGTHNALSGYGKVNYKYSTLEGEVKKKESSLKFSKTTDKTQINRGYSEPQRHEPSKIDCGNTHTNFFKAQSQNIRLRSIYSSKISCSIESITDLKLLEPVYFLLFRESSTDMVSTYTGKYIITSIDTIINTKNQRPTQTINLIREGFNINNDKAKELV